MTSRKPATVEAFEAGKAVFYIPDNQSIASDIELPVKARILSNMTVNEGEGKESIINAGTLVEVIQAEQNVTDGGIILGFQQQDGSLGICTLEEVELLSAL